MRKQHFRPLSRGGQEKSKEGDRKRTREKLKYFGILEHMGLQNETPKTTEKPTEKNVKCTDIERAPVNLTLSGGLFAALYRAARSVDYTYNNYVRVCRDYDHGVVTIEGGYNLEPYLKDCKMACLRSQTKTLVKTNCAHPDAFDMCQEVCEQVMESHARLILTNNYRLIAYELTWENVDFDASLFGESFRIKIDY